jgi:hypothetical protein
LFAVFVLVSFAVLFTPAPEVPSGPEGVDKVIHLALFAALAVSGRYAGIPARVLAPALVAYGGVSELLQGLPGLDRSTSLVDWAADVGGIVLGYAGLVLSTRFRSAATS